MRYLPKLGDAAMTRRMPTILIDALYNTCPASGASRDYARGLVIGILSTLSSVPGASLDVVVRDVAYALPNAFDPDFLPNAFRADIVAYRDEWDAAMKNLSDVMLD